MIWGLFRAGEGNLIKWELKREKLQARLHLEPFIRAEKDRFYLRAKEESDRLEEIAMRHVPGYVMKERAYQHPGYFPELLVSMSDPKRVRYPGLYPMSHHLIFLDE